MSQSAKQGTILLTLAQVWHALSGYLIFITAARILGQEDFGDFGLVAWTMTAVETFVVAGAPKAVSYYVARGSKSSWPITMAGLKITFLIAVVATALMALTSPLVARLWHDPSLAPALRIAAMDFVAFTGFAVMIQAVNGLHRFKRQAVLWMIYSTVKVVAVVGLLIVMGGVQWGIAGYVVASAVASIITMGGSIGLVRSGRDDRGPSQSQILGFGLPMAVHAMVLMAMLTIDIWAAKWAVDNRLEAGGYVAASTLARVLYFVFIAFGEALFPAVARLIKAGQPQDAGRLAREGVTILLCLLIPSVGLATGAAQPTLAAVYGNGSPNDAGFGGSAIFLVILAPAVAAMTLISVLASLIAGAGRPGRIAVLLLGLLGVDTVVVFMMAHAWGSVGAAWGTLVVSLIGLGIVAVWARGVFGLNLFGLKPTVMTVATAGVLHLFLCLWTPPGWWVFPYGGALLGIALAALGATNVLPLRDFIKMKKRAPIEEALSA